MEPRRLLQAVLASVLFGAACALAPALPTEVPGSAQSPKGYVEFYCAECVTGWIVYAVRDGREQRLLTQKVPRRPQDLLHNPVRMRRVGTPLPAGDVEFLIRLLPPSRSQSMSERIRVSVVEGAIIPIRIQAEKQTHITLEWRLVVGPPLPVSNDPASIERLRDALIDTDWGVRWYGAEAIGRIQGEITNEVAAGLQALASEDEYQYCLTNETTIQCSLVQEQAQGVLRKPGIKETAPPSDP